MVDAAQQYEHTESIHKDQFDIFHSGLKKKVGEINNHTDNNTI